MRNRFEHDKPFVPWTARWYAPTAMVVAFVLIVTGTFAIARWRAHTTLTDVALAAGPDATRVAVLYFENQSNAGDLDWLRHGLTDMLITDLSRFDHAAVLGREQLNLLFNREGVNADLPVALDQALAIGHAVKADALVLGSFAAVGETVRFETRVVDGQTGRLIGADAAVADRRDQVLTQVDLLAQHVADRIGVKTRPRSGGSLSDVMTSNLDAYRHYVLGLEKSNAFEVADAVSLFQQAIELDPAFAMAYARIGHAYAVSQSLPERAKPYLQKALGLSSRLTEKDRTYIAAWNAIANLEYDQAIVHLKAIVARYPLEVEAYGRLGILLLTENQPAEAREVLLRGLTVDPDSKDLVNALGKLHHLQGRHQDAIAMHRRYVALSPNEPNAYDSLGLSLQYAGRYDEAIAAYRRALELDPRFQIAAIHLGNTFYQLGQMRAATDQYQRYLDTADYDAERVRGRLAIGWIKFKQGRVSDAWRDFEQIAGRVEPSTETALTAAARGDLKLAEELTGSLAAVDRGRRASRRPVEYTAGEVLLAEGRGAEALDRFRAALREFPATYLVDPFDDCLAGGLLRLKRYDEAITEYTRVLGINPNAARTRFGLAQALEGAGRYPEARAEYEHVLAIWKDADADVPELVAAKQRAGALMSTAAH